MGARVYDPSAGRFLSRDSVLGEDTDPQTQNPYAYGLNSPGRYYDLDGRSALSELEDLDNRLTKPLEDAGNGLIDAAGRATRYYRDVIDDPNANWAERTGARVGSFLTKDVSCMSVEDLAWMIVSRGRGGRSGRTYKDVTTGKSIRNVGTSATHWEFRANLRASGWSRLKTSDGRAEVFEKGNAKYVLRNKADQYDGWTADFYADKHGPITSKIRLGYK